VEWDIPNSPTTKFRIAHLTASFTAAAVLKLVEQGLLDLEAPVCDYVDPCPEGWETMTIDHLVNHKSGLPHFRPMSEPGNWMHETIAPRQFVERVRDAPLLFAPGEEREYSHTNWAVLGYIIERVTGGAFEAYLRENILEPLDMADTGMDKKSLVLPQRAYGYAGARVAEYTDPSQLYSALGMYSTTEDLLKWDQALYTDTLLSQESLDLMFTPGPEPIFRGSEILYGIGWWVEPTGGRPSIDNTGGVSGYYAALVRLPDEKLTIIILSNREDVDAWSLIDFMLAPMIFENE
jgi:CubicO group peptidase (beta-lactamase class C family)